MGETCMHKQKRHKTNQMFDRVDPINQHPIQNLAIKAIGFHRCDTPTQGIAIANNTPRAQREYHLDPDHHDKQRRHNGRQWIYRADISVFLHGIKVLLDAVCTHG